MRPEELMIGDLIMCHNSNFFVTSVDGYGSLIGIDNERDADLVHIDELIPIPLTPEILEKNGAIRLNGFWLFEKNGFERAMLSYCNGNEDYMSEEATEYFGRHWVFDENYRIDYVHELQYALRLCGLNELADNFKVE